MPGRTTDRAITKDPASRRPHATAAATSADPNAQANYAYLRTDPTGNRNSNNATHRDGQAATGNSHIHKNATDLKATRTEAAAPQADPGTANN